MARRDVDDDDDESFGSGVAVATVELNLLMMAEEEGVAVGEIRRHLEMLQLVVEVRVLHFV